MNDLVTLIKDLLTPVWHYFVLFSPIKCQFLREGEIGGRFWLGKRLGESLGPGLHVATSGQTLDKTESEGNLVELKDGIDVFTEDMIPILINAAASYDIVSFFDYARKADAEGLIDEALKAEVLAAYQTTSLQEVLGGTRDIEELIQRGTQERLGYLGIQITRVLVTGRWVKDPAVLRACAFDVMQSLCDVQLNPNLIMAGSVPITTEGA